MELFTSFLPRAVRKVTHIFRKDILRDPVLLNVGKWYKASPAGNLLFEHRLSPQPVIFDIGGFTGEASGEILKRYPQATLHIFEPLPKYEKILRQKFSKHKNVHIHPYGLAAEKSAMTIYHHGEGSSVFREGGKPETIQLENISKKLSELAPKGVDLLMINAEGAEYEILETILKGKAASSIHTLLVQFHTIAPRYHQRYREIAKKLGHTHNMVFRFPFVWEKWVRNS